MCPLFFVETGYIDAYKNGKFNIFTPITKTSASAV